MFNRLKSQAFDDTSSLSPSSQHLDTPPHPNHQRSAMSTRNEPIIPFADQLCFLANITHVRDCSPTMARKSLPDQEKHLDSIPILLVTEEKSDIAAVIFEQTAHEVIFYYSKNRPSTFQERDYLDQLRQIALTVADINQCAMQLLNRVILTISCMVLDTVSYNINTDAPAPPTLPKIMEQLDSEIRALGQIVDQYRLSQSNAIWQGVDQARWTLRSEEVNGR